MASKTTDTSEAGRRRLRAILLAAVVLAGIAGGGGPLLWTRLIAAPAAERLIQSLRDDPLLIDAVRSQNQRLAHQAETDIAVLDATWREEKIKGDGPLLTTMLKQEASRHLAALVDDHPGIRLVILMDNRGRNVAVSWPTTDYFQGDEPKWQETFAKPTGWRHISGLEQGHDGNFIACWISEPLNEPKTGTPLGAFSVEVDVRRTGGALCAP